MEKRELAYQRKARQRGKNRKLRIEQVWQTWNLEEADRNARRRKKGHRGVRLFDRDRERLLAELRRMLMTGEYHTSPGQEVEQWCPCGKMRLLHKLPYYPDHIENHALMQVIMPVMMRHYYYDSSASIEGKGMHFAAQRTEKWIDKHRKAGRLYYAKLDFVKFYHNIDQRKCYERLARKFGNRGIRYLLWEIITACERGLGIGLYPIQPIANFYTCDLCREVMSRFGVFLEIYCDDIVVMSESKKEVWRAVNFIRAYASEVMEQPLHDNIGVQIIDSRHGLDFVGYVFYIGHTGLRKRMKKKFRQKMARLTEPQHRYRVAVSYKGWLQHCDGYRLWCQVMDMKSFKDIQVPAFERRDAGGKRILDGAKTSIGMLVGQPLEFIDVELDVKSKFGKPAAWVQVRNQQGQTFKFITSGPRMIQILQYVVGHDELPFSGQIVNHNASGYPDFDITD
mgnify:CR=1 FL=1